MSEITVNKIKILSGNYLEIAGQVAGVAATEQNQFVTLAQISTTTEGGVTQQYVNAEVGNALQTAKTYSDSNDTDQTDTLTELMVSKDATTLAAAKQYADSLVTGSPESYAEINYGSSYGSTGPNTKTLTLSKGNWLCECYGAVYQCVFTSYSITIDGLTAMTTKANGDEQGCAYSPIAAIKRIEVTADSRDIVFNCTAGGTDTHMVVKATKVI